MLERVEALKVGPRGAVDVLAKLRVAALEACSELGLALVKDCVRVVDARVKVALRCSGAVVELRTLLTRRFSRAGAPRSSRS